MGLNFLWSICASKVVLAMWCQQGGASKVMPARWCKQGGASKVVRARWCKVPPNELRYRPNCFFCLRGLKKKFVPMPEDIILVWPPCWIFGLKSKIVKSIKSCNQICRFPQNWVGSLINTWITSFGLNWLSSLGFKWNYLPWYH